MILTSIWALMESRTLRWTNWTFWYPAILDLGSFKISGHRRYCNTGCILLSLMKRRQNWDMGLGSLVFVNPNGRSATEGRPSERDGRSDTIPHSRKHLRALSELHNGRCRIRTINPSLEIKALLFGFACSEKLLFRPFRGVFRRNGSKNP